MCVNLTYSHGPFQNFSHRALSGHHLESVSLPVFSHCMSSRSPSINDQALLGHLAICAWLFLIETVRFLFVPLEAPITI